jgi:hypothetical protein
MKLQKSERLFFGCKIDSKLREALAQAKPGDRKYFEDPNSEFLRVVAVEEERWIGKVIAGGIQVTDVDDIQRNVMSILKRISPALRITASSIKIFAVAEDGGAPAVIDDGAAGEGDDDEVVGSSSGGGPYIVE